MVGYAARAEGPRVQPPTVVTPGRYKAAAAGRRLAHGERGLPTEWWSIFNDLTLSDLEARAAAANQNVLQATSRIAEERQRARVTGASFLPTVEANLSAQRYRSSNTLAPQRGELIGGFPGLPVSTSTNGTTGPAVIVQNQPLTTTQNDFNLPLAGVLRVGRFRKDPARLRGRGWRRRRRRRRICAR